MIGLTKWECKRVDENKQGESEIESSTETEIFPSEKQLIPRNAYLNYCRKLTLVLIKVFEINVT